MGIDSLSPAEFAAKHRALFEKAVGDKAKQVGARSLSTKLHMEVYLDRSGGDLRLMFDNLKDVESTRKGAIPLKEAWAIDEQLAAAAAEQAARTTGGKLTPLSARFLPTQFRDDYERLTGLTIDHKPGTSVQGVSLVRSGSDVQLDIDFNKALQGVSAQRAVLAVSEHFQVVAERVDPPADPQLPPYWIYLSPVPGTKPGTELRAASGISGFSGDSGHLISAGAPVTVRLGAGYQGPAYETITLRLDAVNDLGSGPAKPPSAATKPARDAWNKYFVRRNADFDMTAALARGELTAVSLDEARKVPGIKVLLSAIRADAGSSVSSLHKKGLLEFFREPQTKTLAALRRFDGEAGAVLSIVDESKKRWIGTFDVADDGTKSWVER